jgi:hypothetical protein
LLWQNGIAIQTAEIYEAAWREDCVVLIGGHGDISLQDASCL